MPPPDSHIIKYFSQTSTLPTLNTHKISHKISHPPQRPPQNSHADNIKGWTIASHITHQLVFETTTTNIYKPYTPNNPQSISSKCQQPSPPKACSISTLNHPKKSTSNKTTIGNQRTSQKTQKTTNNNKNT